MNSGKFKTKTKKGETSQTEVITGELDVFL